MPPSYPNITPQQSLILYSTVDNQTRRICERMQAVMTKCGQQVTLMALEQAKTLNLAPFERIVIGASIRYGKHRPHVAAFLNYQRALLQDKMVALFSVNIVARKPQKNQPHTNPYMIKLLKQLKHRPHLLGVFAGRLNYPALNYLDRQIIRFIMFITKGPTDPSQVFDSPIGPKWTILHAKSAPCRYPKNLLHNKFQAN